MTRPVTPVAILAAQLERAHALAAGLDDYVSACTTPESPALAALAADTLAADWGDDGPLEAEMLSGHVEGQLLRFLVAATRARRVLEIGMFTGYSALAMAEALPPDGVLVACERDAAAAAFAQQRFDAVAAGAKIDVRVGDARATLAALADEPAFDLVFIDADKAGYTDYVRALLDGGLLSEAGLICVDNTLMQGEPWSRDGARSANGGAIATFNRWLADEPRVEQVLLPIRDGLTLVRRAG